MKANHTGWCFQFFMAFAMKFMILLKCFVHFHTHYYPYLQDYIIGLFIVNPCLGYNFTLHFGFFEGVLIYIYSWSFVILENIPNMWSYKRFLLLLIGSIFSTSWVNMLSVYICLALSPFFWFLLNQNSFSIRHPFGCTCFFLAFIYFQSQSVVDGREILKPESMYAIMAGRFPI